jgi:hypothetical protein
LELDQNATYTVQMATNDGNEAHNYCEWNNLVFKAGADAQTATAEMVATADRQMTTEKAKYNFTEDVDSRFSMLANDTIGFIGRTYNPGQRYLHLNGAEAATTFVFDTVMNPFNSEGAYITAAGKHIYLATVKTRTGFAFLTGWRAGGLAGLAAQKDTTAAWDGPYGWECLRTHGNKPAGSEVQWYGSAIGAHADMRLTVVISEGILYVLVDGNAYMRIPLSEIYTEWTADATYRVAIGTHDTLQHLGAGFNKPTWKGTTVSNDTAVAAEWIAKFPA